MEKSRLARGGHAGGHTEGKGQRAKGRGEGEREKVRGDERNLTSLVNVLL
jgi:hypothetical protein